MQNSVNADEQLTEIKSSLNVIGRFLKTVMHKNLILS